MIEKVFQSWEIISRNCDSELYYWLHLGRKEIQPRQMKKTKKQTNSYPSINYIQF